VCVSGDDPGAGKRLPEHASAVQDEVARGILHSRNDKKGWHRTQLIHISWEEKDNVANLYEK
jgi:hypothetical protein